MTAQTQARNPGKREALEAATRLHSLAIHLLRAVRSEDRASGIGPAQLTALSVLVFAGDRSLGELADLEQVRPPTMSRIVAGLERAGLARRRNTADKRQIRLAATPKGARLLREAQKRRVELLAGALAALPPPQIQRLARLVDLVEEVISQLR